VNPAVTVAMQGEPGCNSALAAARFFPGPITLLPCPTFAALFASVRQGEAEYGMAPVENSLAGTVHSVWDLLAKNPLPIRGELYFHVRHCLIGQPGARLEEIRYIYSHEQALAQCQKYIQKLVWIDPENVVPAYDTAGAVKMIKVRGRREEAAIAAPQAAAFYDMQVLAEDIQTDPRNFTRFLVLSHRPAPDRESAYRTTLILGLGDCARGLPAALEPPLDRQLALLKVETRKRVGRPWEYQVYLEFSGRADTPAVAAALQEIRQRTADFHLVGSYPAAD
jgi:prephenate dehydratase